MISGFMSYPSALLASALRLFPVLPAFDFIVISSNAGKSGPLIIHVLIVNQDVPKCDRPSEMERGKKDESKLGDKVESFTTEYTQQ
jgi:hypothetical protein